MGRIDLEMCLAAMPNRFMSKLNIKGLNECWEWKARCNRLGYGLYDTYLTATEKKSSRDRYEGIQKYIVAHRYMYFYMKYKGNISLQELLRVSKANNDMFVLHSCDNPSCCNPLHLTLGTPKDNVRDMVAKGRHSRGLRHVELCKKSARKGEDCSNAKLTVEDVLTIRKRYAQGERQFIIHRDYPQVSKNAIAAIVNHRKWKWLPELT